MWLESFCYGWCRLYKSPAQRHRNLIKLSNIFFRGKWLVSTQKKEFHFFPGALRRDFQFHVKFSLSIFSTAAFRFITIHALCCAFCMHDKEREKGKLCWRAMNAFSCKCCYVTWKVNTTRESVLSFFFLHWALSSLLQVFSFLRCLNKPCNVYAGWKRNSENLKCKM